MTQRAFHGCSSAGSPGLPLPRAKSALSMAAAVLLRSAMLFHVTDVVFAFLAPCAAALGCTTSAGAVDSGASGGSIPASVTQPARTRQGGTVTEARAAASAAPRCTASVISSALSCSGRPCTASCCLKPASAPTIAPTRRQLSRSRRAAGCGASAPGRARAGASAHLQRPIRSPCCRRRAPPQARRALSWALGWARPLGWTRCTTLQTPWRHAVTCALRSREAQ